MAREEEERAAAREAMLAEETAFRDQMMSVEKVERLEVKLQKNDSYMSTMVFKKAHQQLQQKFTELSRSAASEKNQLEKHLAQLTRAKDALDKEVNDLKSVYKVEGADLAVITRKLTGEMNSQGKCYVCVECARTIYKERPRNASVVAG